MLGIAIDLDLWGGLAYQQHHFQQAKEYFEESLLIWRNSGNQIEVAWVLYTLGYIAIKQNDWAGAEVLLKESLVINQEQDRKQTSISRRKSSDSYKNRLLDITRQI